MTGCRNKHPLYSWKEIDHGKNEMKYPLLPLLFICFCHLFLSAADVYIDSEIDQSGGVWEKQPLKGMISITHNRNDQVDESSFRLDKKPLNVQFVQEVQISSTSPLVISYYQFTLDGKPKGLQILPSVSVKVGGSVYKSAPSTYQVGEVTISPQPASNSASKSFLKLEATLEAPAEIYPGTRFKVVYRYIFNDNIELAKEELPLFQGKGFLKIGTEEAKDIQQGAYSMRVISQTLEATKPGSYKFDSSLIQGRVYRNDPFGGHIYLQPMLSSTTQPMTITVLPFPEKGKPASFNGAVGTFTDFSVKLLSAPTMSVGDKIALDIKISGKGQMGTVTLPDLCCQPGFSGVFQLSDLPPTEKIVDTTKEFTVEMRPLIADITAIPSAEFSFFIPESKTYGLLHSKPIPITVKALPKPVQEQPAAKPKTASPVDWRKVSHEPTPIEIISIAKLTPADLKNRLLGTWWVLWMIPVGIAAIWGQILLRKYLKQRKGRVKQKTSQEIFNEALVAGAQSPLFYQLLNKAFMMRLVEKGLIKSIDIDPENLPRGGNPGLVRNFLLKIDEKRFSGQEPIAGDQLIQEAKEIFKKIT